MLIMFKHVLLSTALVFITVTVYSTYYLGSIKHMPDAGLGFLEAGFLAIIAFVISFVAMIVIMAVEKYHTVPTILKLILFYAASVVIIANLIFTEVRSNTPPTDQSSPASMFQ